MSQIDFNRKIKEGDAVAFENFFKLTHPRLLSYCKLFISDHAQADDLVQECYLKLWEKKESINPAQSVESLLFVMLRHRCLNYLRDQKFYYSETDINSIREIDLQHLFELDFTGVEKKSVEEELIEAIRLEIDNLPEKRKLVFINSKINGMKNREIAEELGISLKAVEKHLHQAKEQIHSALLAKYPMLAILISLILR